MALLCVRGGNVGFNSKETNQVGAIRGFNLCHTHTPITTLTQVTSLK